MSDSGFVFQSFEERRMMGDRKGIITLQGNPLTLTGNELKAGDTAPDFTVLDGKMNEVSLSAYKGKTVLISSVPSLDTPTCHNETLHFNEEAPNLAGDSVILTISMDLPFAQNRWCQANSANNVLTLSDYRDAEFGNAYGVLIKELRLLARTIFIVDKLGIIRYIQIVKEIAEEPNYDEVLGSLRNL
jgi:thiol peroxidase